ncbi:hypothetical protein PGT21_006650 [Puccinia graminis f. sp. tritici]|uniref:Uncharacterized protein n=1 Tax=Puccinia graminis f. sp. tritici TaxID=56615 RepID=A0A5B0LK43_PUCGR|nr:hypothetical protein PGTUg99_002442 [Puccinia graminis f. sp. tritici]KAA1103108.1 hypothetical protein PGT21_006650 [Puccinia graminis f. sp. tritici]
MENRASRLTPTARTESQGSSLRTMPTIMPRRRLLTSIHKFTSIRPPQNGNAKTTTEESANEVNPFRLSQVR